MPRRFLEGDFFGMATFRWNTEEKQSGKTVYNAGIVKGIVAIAVSEVEGTLPLPKRRPGRPGPAR